MSGADASLVTRTRRMLADGVTPVGLYHTLVGTEGVGFILESVDQQGRWARYSFVGRRPLGELRAEREGLVVTGWLPALPEPGEGVLDFLRRVVAALPRAGADVPLAGGLVGFVGYDVVREIEPTVPARAPDDLGLPDALWWLAGELVVFDHWAQTLTLVVLAHSGADADAVLGGLADEVAAARMLGASELVIPPEGAERALLDASDEPRYLEMVSAAREHILAGDIFQVVLSRRFDFPLGTNRLSLYRALRLTNPSPYMYLISHPRVAVVGSSPEALVTLAPTGRVLARPIAGTTRRGASDAEDEGLIAALRADPKERAEHVMLVDLARNDLGKVARFGSVSVEQLMVAERFARVIHMTSEVSAVLREGVGSVDLLAATLPAGTLSGAPKVRAMTLIDELETVRRGIYGGVVGYFGPDGSMDLAIAIRTAVIGPDGVCHLQAGAGVVADSDPAREAAECVAKASAVARAVLMARALPG